LRCARPGNAPVPILVLVQDSAQDRLVKALDLNSDYAVMPVGCNEIARAARRSAASATPAGCGLDRAGAGHGAGRRLTGLSNRRYAERHLETLVRRFADSGRPMGV
jgi:PleD family two-component response regulator